MKALRLAILTVLPAMLLCAAFTTPAHAGTFTYTMDHNSPKCTAGTLCTVTNVMSGEGYWSFTVNVTGKVSSLQLSIKDSSPGASDFCWNFLGRQPSGTIFISTSPTVIPAATTDACGTQWADSNGAPLALVTYIQTSDPNAKVVITVTYPDPPVALNRTTFKEGDLSAAGRVRDQYVLGKTERYDTAA